MHPFRDIANCATNRGFVKCQVWFQWHIAKRNLIDNGICFKLEFFLIFFSDRSGNVHVLTRHHLFKLTTRPHGHTASDAMSECWCFSWRYTNCGVPTRCMILWLLNFEHRIPRRRPSPAGHLQNLKRASGPLPLLLNPPRLHSKLGARAVSCGHTSGLYICVR